MALFCTAIGRDPVSYYHLQLEQFNITTGVLRKNNRTITQWLTGYSQKLLLLL